ncbi:MAG: MmpS family protein [Mycobacterium sp.]|nr:MmpS family protein [Mycobacterium sp.]
MKRKSVRSAIARGWLVWVTIGVVALAAFAVYRTQGMFGSHSATGSSGAMPDQIVPFNPKRVQLEVFGAPGAAATITYLDVNATPQHVDTLLPWSYQDSTTVPAVLTNIQAQTDGSTLGCRITIDGVVKVEQSSQGADAYVFCLDKSG